MNPVGNENVMQHCSRHQRETPQCCLYLKIWLLSVISDLAGDLVFTSSPQLHLQRVWRLLWVNLHPSILLASGVKRDHGFADASQKADQLVTSDLLRNWLIALHRLSVWKSPPESRFPRYFLCCRTDDVLQRPCRVGLVVGFSQPAARWHVGGFYTNADVADEQREQIEKFEGINESPRTMEMQWKGN